MRSHSPKVIDAALLLALLVGIALAAPAQAAPAQTAACAGTQARAWVEAHQGELPSTFEELTVYPVELRMAIVNALDPLTRGRLWREHFRRLLDRSDLSSSQRGVIERAAGMPELFVGDDGDPAIEARLDTDFRDLAREAIEAFGRSQGTALLSAIGSTAGPAPMPGPIPSPKCTCAVDSDCPPGLVCDETEICTPTRLGCGSHGTLACIGRCVEP